MQSFFVKFVALSGGLLGLPMAFLAEGQEHGAVNVARPAPNGGASGEFEVVFEPVTARYARLVAYSEATGENATISAAEIRLVSDDGVTVLPREGWTALEASNATHEGSERAANAFDNNLTTKWVSVGEPPHFIDIDLGARQRFAALRYVPAAGDPPGAVNRFAIFVSDDGVSWGLPIMRGVMVGEAEPDDEAQGAPQPIVLKREVFAEPALVHAPVAISVDEKNRVYVAETYRYEGRGVIDNRGKTRRELDDLRTNSLEERQAVLQQWIEDGEIRLELDKRASDFSEGDDLFTKYSEKVALLEDTDGDGVADRRMDYADGFNEMLTGAAAGVLAVDDDVYFTCIPNVWKMRDDDGDGRADVKEVLSRGYGVRTGWYGHDLHGLTLGLDGRIYFSMADRGFHVTTKEGKVLHGPGTGGVFRCWPDGSELELFASGMRNPQELAFDAYGNLFTGDNNCDAGDKARLVYVVEGGDSGWNMTVQSLEDRGPWLREHMWERRQPGNAMQPAWLLSPLAYVNSGPSGFAYNPGTGLPSDYDGYFFLCDYRGGRGSIQAFKVEPEGASFLMRGHHAFDEGPTVSDVTFGYDGRVYASEWGAGWDINPKAQIYTLSHEVSREDPVVTEVTTLFAEGFDQRSPEELVALLGHQDQRVRQRAQFALVRKKEIEALSGVLLFKEKDIFARLHALWGLGQLGREEASAKQALVTALALENDELRSQALRLCGELGIVEAVPVALSAISSGNARLQFQAAYALGKLAPPEASAALLALLESNADRDAYLRHAAVMGLVYLNQPDGLVASALAGRPDAVRLGAVLALRRLDEPRVAGYLSDSSEVIVTETARAIFDREIKNAFPDLAKALDTATVRNDAFLRRAIETSFRLGGFEEADRLCRFALNNAMPKELRRWSMELLLAWADAPDRDLWGRWRPIVRSNAGEVVTAVRQYLNTWLQEPDRELLTLAQRLDQVYGQEKTPEQLANIVRDSERVESLRVDALLELEKRKISTLEQVARTALSAEGAPILRGAALSTLVRLLGGGALPLIKDVLLSAQTSSEKQEAILSLNGLSTPESIAFVGELLAEFAQGKLDPVIGLEVLEVAKSLGDPALQADVERIQTDASPVSLAPYSLQGGDPKKGRLVFETNLAAQCMRCHAVDGKGGDVGPGLNGLATRYPPEYILESVLNPQAKVALGYGVQTVTTDADAILTGILIDENETEILLKEGSEIRRVPLSGIKERSELVSGMPPIGSLLKPRELRDLMAYLFTLK